MAFNDWFVIRFPNGEIRYEPMNGVAPSQKVREMQAEYGPEVKVGMTTNPPREVLEEIGIDTSIKEGDLVRYQAYGGTYYGKVVRCGPKRADVTVTLQSGREKILKNKPLSELTKVKPI